MIFASWILIAAVLAAPPVQPASPPQSGDLRCGSYCLFAALKALDVPVDNVQEIESKIGQPTRIGYSMQQLADAVSMFGAYSIGLETSLEQLEAREGPFACIAALDEGHFVCIYDVDQDHVFVIDPPDRRVMTRAGFGALWGGKALLVSSRPIAALPPRSPYRWILLGSVVAAACVGGVVLLVKLGRDRR